MIAVDMLGRVGLATILGLAIGVERQWRSRMAGLQTMALVSMGAADMLLDLGHSVTEAQSGAHALTLLESDGPFDVVVTDYAMPGMTGVEAIANTSFVGKSSNTAAAGFPVDCRRPNISRCNAESIETRRSLPTGIGDVIWL